MKRICCTPETSFEEVKREWDSKHFGKQQPTSVQLALWALAKFGRHAYSCALYRATAETPTTVCDCGYGSELDFKGYNDAGDARRGHMEMIGKWAREPQKKPKKRGRK